MANKLKIVLHDSVLLSVVNHPAPKDFYLSYLAYVINFFRIPKHIFRKFLIFFINAKQIMTSW